MEEVVNLCLMANIEENPSYSSDLILSFTLDELHDAFNDLMNEFENVSVKNNVLKKKLKSLDKEVSLLKEEKDSWNNEKKMLKAQNDELQEKNKYLKLSLEKANREKEELKNALEIQRKKIYKRRKRQGGFVKRK